MDLQFLRIFYMLKYPITQCLVKSLIDFNFLSTIQLVITYLFSYWINLKRQKSQGINIQSGIYLIYGKITTLSRSSL